MPAPSRPGPEQFADALGFISENAAAAVITAEIVQRYAAAGNIPGLRYAVRCMCAHIRACRGGMQAIDEVIERQARATAAVRPASELATTPSLTPRAPSRRR